MPLANELELITLPDSTTQALCPRARDAFPTVSSRTSVCWVTKSIFCRGDRERNYHQLFRKVCLSSPLPIRDLYLSSCSQIASIPSSYPHYNTTSSPCSSNTLRALRGTRIIFLLLKQFSSELETEAEVIFMPPIKLISGETDAGKPRPGWMRSPTGKAPLYTSLMTLTYCTGDHAILYMHISGSVL
jgi:hypothetical protein